MPTIKEWAEILKERYKNPMKYNPHTHDTIEDYERLGQSWMALKDDYGEICRALGITGDAWFGDPLVEHKEIIKTAKALVVNKDKINNLLDHLLTQLDNRGVTVDTFKLIDEIKQIINERV